MEGAVSLFCCIMSLLKALIYFMNYRTRAFTLIELLVVIAIIGILSSVVLTNMNGTRAKARDVKRIADIQQIQLALALYFDSHSGKYPGTLTPLVPDYFSVIPAPPSGSYFYKPLNVYSGACNGYHLGAILEQSTNTNLTNDVDAVPGIVATSGCGGSDQASGDDFYGSGANCVSSGGTELCYDVAS